MTNEINSTRIELPVRRYSLLSHTGNIDYCLEQIRKNSNEETPHVIVYTIERASGTRHVNHVIIAEEQARALKRENPGFDYKTIDDLTKRKAEIEQGKYKLLDGLIVDLNPAYQM